MGIRSERRKRMLERLAPQPPVVCLEYKVVLETCQKCELCRVVEGDFLEWLDVGTLICIRKARKSISGMKTMEKGFKAIAGHERYGGVDVRSELCPKVSTMILETYK